MGFFQEIGKIYGGAKTLIKEAGITEIKAGDLTIGLNPKNIAVNETHKMTASPIQVIAKPQIPTNYLIIGGVVVLGVLVLAVKAFK